MTNGRGVPSATGTGGAALPSAVVAAAPPAQGNVPPIDRYVSHYERYNGKIGQGANRTTHTAEVRFGGGPIGLAVVKGFPLADKGWLNEAVAWTLGRSLGLAVPPRAAILVAAPSDLVAASEPELSLAYQKWGGAGPIVFWCASRLDTRPPQHAISMSWEKVVMRGENGQRLAAFDGWIANCDRIADNAPYWVTRGLIAAIDHERMVFAQDWISSSPQHLDQGATPRVGTRLLDQLKDAQKKGAVKPKSAKAIVAALDVMSMEHAVHLRKLKAEIEQELLVNVGNVASSNLMSFLDDRSTRDFISKRLEVL